jgi:hypothetical protein
MAIRLALAIWLVVLGAVAAWAQVEGRYNGLDAASGMVLTIEESGSRAGGTLTMEDGREIGFRGEVVGETVEATFTDGGVRVYLRAVTEPIGARVVLVPMDEQNQLRVDRTRSYAFLREGVALPERPTRYMPPPTSPPRAIEPRAFVSSYPFWPPLSVAMAYEALEPRFRSVVKLYPLVQADLLWKLCASPQRTPGIAEALRGQGVGCADVMAAFEEMQRSGSFDRFKRDVASVRDTLVTTLGCADDLRRLEPACRDAASETARRAVSMETAGTVLARYR